MPLASAVRMIEVPHNLGRRIGEFLGGLADDIDNIIAIGTDVDGDAGAEALEVFVAGAGGLVRG